MLRKKGIVRKTFLFSSLLIVLIILLSFSVLYFAMPGYYLYQKEKTLQSNINSLSAELRSAATRQECISLISGFVARNNADVAAFGGDNMLLPDMSSPFVSIQNVENGKGIYAVFPDPGEGMALNGRVTFSVRPDSEPVAAGQAVQWWISGDASGAEQITKLRAVTLKSKDSIFARGDVGAEFVSYIVASGTLQPIDEAKGVILSLIPYALVGAAAVGLLLAWFYARQISKPILAISDAAVKMRVMEPDASSGIQSDDELGQLSKNLNDLYADLRANIEGLRAEMERVNRLERSKTEMMQSASHELKTPVAALAGMLDGMIDNVGAYKDRDKYLAECKGQVEKLSLLVMEILDASRADGAGMETAVEETSADCLLEQALDEYGAIIDEKELNLIKDISPASLTTDPAALYRVFANLISNAARYTPEKGEIRVSLSGGVLSIENTCEHILDDELEKLFEPFCTRSLSRDKTHSGTGLGLYIVKRSLERLGVPYRLENTEAGIKITLTLY